jgi:hypothetical protein
LTSKLCKYGCGIELEGFDEQARKYREAATGGLHTKERCQEAKAKLQAKNDHGNELVQPLHPVGDELAKPPYVDHTAKGVSKVKIFWSQNSQVLETEYNAFLDLNNGKIKVQGGQFQFNNGNFAIALYYEEVPA